MTANFVNEHKDFVAFLRFPQPPAIHEGTPLAALVDSWLSLEPDEADPDVARAVAHRWAGSFTEQSRGRVEDELHRHALALRHAIGKAIDNGATDPRLIRTADFSAVTPWRPAGAGLPLAAAHVESKSRHLCDPFSIDGKPCLLLGVMATLALPRPWYLVRDAVALTTSYRTKQQQDEEEHRRREKLKEEAEQAAREADPQWQISQLKARIAQLEAQSSGGKSK